MTDADVPKVLQEIAEACDGRITEVGRLPDNSGFAMMSMPLPKTHWIYAEPENGFDAPPMIFKMGSRDMLTIRTNMTTVQQLDKQQMKENIRIAGKYAVRAATMRGKEMDLDPDALLQNLVVAFLGYFTEDGLDHEDDWANPPRFRKGKP